MSADFYYNDYAFRDNPSKSLRNERKKIIKKSQLIKSKKNKRSFLAISLLLVMSVILIYLYGQLMEVNYSLNYSRNKLNTLSVKTEEVKASLSTQISTEEIKLFAKNELGLHEPGKDQVKYLSIGKDDTTLLCTPRNDGKDPFEFLLSIFK